jgi:hypothetical protein
MNNKILREVEFFGQPGVPNWTHAKVGVVAV